VERIKTTKSLRLLLFLYSGMALKTVSRSFRFWSIASLMAIVNLVVFDALMMHAPETMQVQYTPDDAYYYLQLAKNYAKFGYWTFDSGFSITSGFHLLHAYLLAFLYRLTQANTLTFVQYGLILSNVLTLSLALFVWWKGYRRRDPYFLLSLALIASTTSFLVNSTSIVEWPLVIWCAAAYCFVVYDRPQSPRAAFLLFFLGLLLSLARSDSGLLPFSFFAASLILSKRHNENGRVIAAAAGLGGALLGVLLILLHNYAFTGEVIQSSAKMKAFWSQFNSQSFYGAFSTIMLVLGIDLKTLAFQRSVYLAGLELVSGAVILIILSKRSGTTELPLQAFKLDKEKPRELTMTLAAIICLAGYLLFYAYSGGLQNWYTANLIAPVFILGVAIGHYLDQRIIPEQHFTMAWFSTAAVMTIVMNLYTTYPISTERAPWPHQQSTLAAALYLHENPPDGRIGAWNAGVIGYYQGGTIINIDGLVNEDIYPFAISNTLPLYLKEKGITYIIDFENMLHPPFSLRGGYNDPAFLGKLEPLMQFDDGQYPEWKFLRLYRINP
jgi:hypothetical protein